MLVQEVLFHSFQWLGYYSIVYVYHVFFIHSFVSGYLGCVHVLAIVNSAAVNIGVHVSFWFMVFSRHMPRSGIAESCSSCIFSVLRNLLFFIVVPIYIPTNTIGGFPSLHTLSSIYCLWTCFMITIWTGVKWCLLVLICISLIIEYLDAISKMTDWSLLVSKANHSISQ